VGKLQQLSLAIEKLTQQVAAQKSALEAEVTDTQVCCAVIPSISARACRFDFGFTSCTMHPLLSDCYPHKTIPHPLCLCMALCFDLQAAQIQLDRAAQDFRQLHQKRQDLIRQWDEARDAMKSRDEAIQVSPDT
jgi:hypothetical protein